MNRAPQIRTAVWPDDERDNEWVDLMKWEYKTLFFEAHGWFLGGKLDGQNLSDQLNELGAEGWELVSAFDTNAQGGATRDVVAILKRSVNVSASTQTK